jgi:hypothetical protein
MPARAVAREPIRVESGRQRDAARALEMLHVQLISAVIDPYCWKWALATLHHVVHLFILATEDEVPAGVEPMHEELLEDGGAPGGAAGGHGRDDLARLYERLKVRTGYRPVERTDRDLARLMACREALMVSAPVRWNLCVTELPGLARSSLALVEFLGWNPGHIRWRRQSAADLARVKLMASMRVLEALDRQYRSE